MKLSETYRKIRKLENSELYLIIQNNEYVQFNYENLISILKTSSNKKFLVTSFSLFYK